MKNYGITLIGGNYATSGRQCFFNIDNQLITTITESGICFSKNTQYYFVQIWREVKIGKWRSKTQKKRKKEYFIK